MAEDPKKVEDRLYARKFGDWVTARLVMRIDACHAVPNEVKVFLDEALQKKASDSKADEATYAVLGWLIKSIENPDWPEPEEKEPQPTPK